MISVFGGSGFIGGKYCELFSDKVLKIERESRKPESKDILYFISTIDNYHVFDNVFFVGCSPTITDSMIEYIEEVIDLYCSKFL